MTHTTKKALSKLLIKNKNALAVRKEELDSVLVSTQAAKVEIMMLLKIKLMVEKNKTKINGLMKDNLAAAMVKSHPSKKQEMS